MFYLTTKGNDMGHDNDATLYKPTIVYSLLARVKTIKYNL